jgi:hypothetical protein
LDVSDAWYRHRGSNWATALSSSAVVGLATAITAPTVPLLIVATATMGLVAGWLAATKADEALSEKKPD